jgi:hypothetical protein
MESLVPDAFRDGMLHGHRGLRHNGQGARSLEDEMSAGIIAIRDLPGVRSTLTLVVCKEHKR